MRVQKGSSSATGKQPEDQNPNRSHPHKFWPPATNHRPLFSCLLPTACCLLPTAYCLLPTAYCPAAGNSTITFSAPSVRFKNTS
ncbi:hypothetical protein Mal52_40900 [Symmachiella dynata]|uniref:Uncharacterized protein n=1 Tax=Symmachiella dynata TaxID=2527995 RepID=A0A517ZSZ0_9PLAN|nr:hypothetical protein Mal52_40900 [Symmachiella dynata]